MYETVAETDALQELLDRSSPARPSTCAGSSGRNAR